MNIVKMQNNLKDFSDRQLLDSMQTGSAPQYLVLAEMQRRKKMRTEASDNKPMGETSVAEEIMGGIASMPTQNMRMASGGIVGFAGGGKTSAYSKGAAEACWENPETGKTECPQSRALKKGFAPGGDVYKDIESIESSGRQFAKDGSVLTSPKGAKGLMQVMPTTAMDPGYGARNIFQLADDLGVDYGGKKDLETANLLLANPMLNRAMGKEYYDAMERRFGSEEAAKAAYNAGPGRVDRSGFAESGDRESLPDETQDYLTKADKLKAKRELPTQTAAEGIAALGEGKMSLTDSEKAPRYSDEELIARGTSGKPIDWTNVPGDSPLRGVFGKNDGYGDEGMFYDQGGAWDVRDMIGQQYGSPTIYENTTDPYNNNLPIRPTGDDGLMALAPKSPRGKVKGLLPGEKIVNAAEPATAETYTEIRKPTPANEYGDYLASLDSKQGPMTAAQVIAGLGEGKMSLQGGESQPTKRASEDPELAAMIASLTSRQPGRVRADSLEGIARLTEDQYLADRAAAMQDNEFDEGDTGPVPTPSMPEPDELEGYDNPSIPEKGDGRASSLPAAMRKTKKEAEDAEAARVAEIDKQIADAGGKTNAFATMPETRQDPRQTQLEDMVSGKTEKSDKLGDFLLNTGLGMLASKRPDFFGALGEGGLKGVEALTAAKKAEQAAEEARLLEAGRMKRASMSEAATRYAADVGLKAKQIESIRKTIEDIREELVADPTMSDTLKTQKLLEIQRLGKMMNDMLGTRRKDASLATVK